MSDKNMFDEAFPADRQVGGTHYSSFLIQPWTFIRKNGLNPFQSLLWLLLVDSHNF